MDKKTILEIRKVIAKVLIVAMMVGVVLQDGAALTAKAATGITITEAAGYEEGAYAEFTSDLNATGYAAYVKKAGAADNTYVKLDNELIRKYANYIRVDAVGLAKGSYILKIVPVYDNVEKAEEAQITTGLEVINYDRSGFAFSSKSKYKTGSGAYKEDGTLRAGAKVLYVTAENASTVTMDVVVDNKGKIDTCTGLQSILDAREKGFDHTPLAIRIIGCIKRSDLDHISSSAEGLQIKGKGYTEMNITLEGIGEDAAVHGFGFLIRACGNVEFRNFAIMDFMDDGVSIDTNNCNLWIHDMDIFYGQAGGDSDQAKGDGTIDIKKSSYITVSYNHFWDSGKSSLCGMSDTDEFMVTYHHNWFDHSDSRHPRIRVASVHIYNNYFDGNSKYGVGTTKGSSAFVEGNYFRNCKNPMMCSKMGTDALASKGTFSGEAGGMIKAYDNVVIGASSLVYANSDQGTIKANATSFDAYLVENRDDPVPASYVSLEGKTPYNNFDTSADYDLAVDPENVDAAADVPAKVQKWAGRVNGGDLKYTFDNASQDENYSVIPALKTAVVNYKTSLVSVGGNPLGTGAGNGAVNGGGTEGDDENNGTGDDPSGNEGGGNTGGGNEGGGNTGGGNTGAGTYVHNFTTDGKTSQFFTITGNLSKDKGSCTYDGKNLTQCLKMESSTNITFTAPDDGKLTLVFGGSTNPSDKKVKINGTNYTCGSDGIVTQDVNKGKVEVKKADGINLFYMIYKSNSTGGSGGDDAADYIITIDKADGAATTTLIVEKGTMVTAEQVPTPVRNGYEFVRWVDEDDETVTVPFKPTGNMTITAEWQDVGEVTPDPDAVYNMELIALDIPGGTYTSDFTKNGFTIHANDAKDEAGKATGSVSVDVASGKKINNVTYTGRLKLSGVGTKDYRSISFTTTGAATLNMACIVATTNDTRIVHVAELNAQGGLVDITTPISISGKDGNYVTVALPEAGTYYIYADGGVNIYALKVTYPEGEDPVYCTVKFNAMGGLSVDDQKCLPGELCMNPGETLKDGYEFDGWYTDFACTTEFDFGTAVTRNMTLFAKWKLDENPGKYLTLDMKDLPARDYMGNFSKNGFTFAAAASASMTVEASGATVDGVNYTQKLKFNGTGNDSARNLSFTIEGNATLTVVVESASSSTARELVVKNGTATQNITDITTAAKYTKELTAGTWTIYPKKDGMNIYYISVEGAGVVEHYTITINKKDGTTATKKTITAGTQLTAEDLPTLTKEGDTFLGWADENGNLLDVPYTPNRSMTITAKWQSDSPVDPKEQYTITIDRKDGTEAINKTINEGDALTAEDLPTLTKEGYKFLGWADEEGNLLPVPYTPTRTMTITAKWQSESTQPDPGPDPGTGDGGDTSFDGEDWKKVANPVIDKTDYTSSDGVDKNGKLTITVKADVSDKGGTSLDVTVKKEGAATGETKTSTTKQQQHTFVFAIPGPGKYEVTAALKRNGMEDKVVKKIVTVNANGQTDTSSGREGLYVELLDNDTDYVYTGSAIKPAIVVYNGDELLTEGTDYTVKYTNNVKAAKKGDPKAPTITVTGKGRYTGKTTQTFTIQRKSLEADDVKIGGLIKDTDTLVVAENARISPIVVYKGMVLKAGDKKDFKLTTNLTKDKPASTDSNKTITIEGVNNYKDTLTLTLDVKKASDLKKISSVTVDKKAAGYEYNGEKKAAPITEVKAKGVSTPLKENDEYIVVYNGNQTSAGTQKFTVIGVGIYTGSKTSSFTISPRKNAPLKLTNELADASGNVSCAFNSAGVTFNNKLTVRDEGLNNAELVLGKDYKVSYSANKKVGNGTYTVTFLGNYKGSAALKNNFTITAANLADMTEVNDPSEKEGLYLKSADKAYGKKAAVIKSAPFVLVDGVALKGSDYTVKYYLDENKTTEMKGKDKVDLSTETSKTVWVEITGKKNYTGTVMTSFEVVKPTTDRPTDISKAKIKVKDNKVEYTGEAVYPSSIEIKVGKNSPVTLNYNAATDSWSGGDNFDVLVVNNIAKGKATVIVTGTGSNVGSKTATFNVVAHNLNNEKAETFWYDFKDLQSILVWPRMQSVQ